MSVLSEALRSFSLFSFVPYFFLLFRLWCEWRRWTITNKEKGVENKTWILILRRAESELNVWWLKFALWDYEFCNSDIISSDENKLKLTAIIICDAKILWCEREGDRSIWEQEQNKVLQKEFNWNSKMRSKRNRKQIMSALFALLNILLLCNEVSVAVANPIEEESLHYQVKRSPNG